jgi:hypothetical protein
MRHCVRAFALPALNANSPTVLAGDLRERTVHLVAANATLQLQCSVAGAAWTNVGAAVTSGTSAFVDMPQGAPLARVVVSAYAGSGSSAHLAGFEAQTSA